jgi:hypothetical protein
LPYKLSWPPAEQKNLANLAGKDSKIGGSCQYELKNLANLAEMNTRMANLPK